MNIASSVLLADMWDTNGHMGGGWWIVMMFWMVLFWGAVILGIVWLVRGGASQSWRAPREATPLETLDRRFAEGAISVDEYHERRQALTGRADDRRAETREPVPHSGPDRATTSPRPGAINRSSAAGTGAAEQEAQRHDVE
jgi:putative membrane protein